jgi:branched-chain amino acid transport system ATP-binding protein
MSEHLLEVRDLDVYYGRVHALKSVTLELGHGEIVAVLGANGAGKTTLLRTLIGALKPANGTLRLDRMDLLAADPSQRVARGMALVPEGRQVFVSLTVEENLLIGAASRGDNARQSELLEQLYGKFPNLAERRHLDARVLSGGEQQMLAIGRALMSQPRVLLLDEPSLGLSPALVNRVYDLLAELNRSGIAMLVVEQNVAMALDVAARAYVLELGRIVAEGPSATLLHSQTLQEAYLGRPSAGD